MSGRGQMTCLCRVLRGCFHHSQSASQDVSLVAEAPYCTRAYADTPPDADAPVLNCRGATPRKDLPELRILGKGSYGTVYEDTLPSGERVAVKCFPYESSYMAQREAAILRRISHASIVRLIEYRQTAVAARVVMEFAGEETLLDHLLKHGHLAQPFRQRVFGELADALAYLHAARIAHRDVKLDNIVLDAAGRSRLVDFGLSYVYGSEEVDERLNDSCGTLHYRAPESFRRGPYSGFTADAWSAGVVLFAMIYCRFPFMCASARCAMYLNVQWQQMQQGASAIDAVRRAYTDPLDVTIPTPVERSLLDGLLRVDATRRATLRDVCAAIRERQPLSRGGENQNTPT